MADNPLGQNQTETESIIESITARGPLGSLDSPVARALWGINHRSQPGAIPTHKDQQGYVFFSRPNLNLSSENIQFDRRLAFLNTNEPMSINAYIRCMLDPSLQGRNEAQCPLVDPHQAFIPILTETIESISGFRDIAPGVYTTPEGMFKESMSWIDGPSVDYTTYDIPASFRNIVTNIVTRMSFVWTHYQSLVMQGVIVPYPNYWLDHEADFNTRIFKLNMDQTKTYVTQITSTIAEPTSSPVGAAANFEKSGPYNRTNDQVSVNFRCHGMETYDAILLEEFNEVVCYRNEFMRDGKREASYKKIPTRALQAFNYAGYPRIDPNTNELEWWVPNADYAQIMGNED